jgi:AMMECR1 domain-containing protein
VENGGRRGLLLPDLDGVETADFQLKVARRKAGIGANESVKLYRFTVTRIA